MVLGYHVIMGAYGFWLPNDPRGSWSDFVRAWELLRFGPATKVDTRRSVAGQPHDPALRRAAKEALRYPPAHFDGLQARAVGVGFDRFLQKSGAVIWACSILPEHTHLVVARFRYRIEQLVNLLKGEATRTLEEENQHPLREHRMENGRVPRCWAAKEWKVFLNSPEDIRRAIRYVEQNPIKEGKPAQRWWFVTPYV